MDVERHQPQFYTPHTVDITEESDRHTIQTEVNAEKEESVNVTPGEMTSCDNGVWGIGGNVKSKKVVYGSKPFCLEPISRENATCYLENDFIEVYNLNNRMDVDIITIISFPCHTGYFDPSNGGYSPSLDAFFNAIQTVKMYSDWYDFTPFKDIRPKALVHFGENIDNAFWDGQTLILGDGGPETFPYTSLDTVAHEMSHGVTERSSGLAFRDESGAINDAFSDMAGEIVECYFRGNNDWIVGAEVVKADNMGIRYFNTPERDGASISHVSQYDKDTKIHRASGIFNKVFYTVSQTIDIRKTFQAFLTANRIYWTELVTFEKAACDVIKAAYDTGLAMETFQRAFQDVGILLLSCPDFEEFILTLSTNETRDNLIVSKSTQPLFRLEPSSEVRFVEISLYGSNDAHIYVTSSYERDENKVIVHGTQTLKFELVKHQTKFLRIASNDLEDHKVSIEIHFSK